MAPRARRLEPCSTPRISDAQQHGTDLSVLEGKKTRYVGWTLNLTEWGPVKKWLPDATQANFLFAQETHLPKDSIGNEESRMRSQGWRASILPALCRWHGEWDKQTARSTGRAGVLVAAAIRHVLATPCGAVQGPRACAPSQWHCHRRGAALVGVSAHKRRSHTKTLMCSAQLATDRRPMHNAVHHRERLSG